MAMFHEVFSSAGVDESVTPPGMMVPLDLAGNGNNFNIVRLTSTAGGRDFARLSSAISGRTGPASSGGAAEG